METPPNAAVGAKEFEVTGVSRSGRVRKKSSKLLDFQSPDELEKKPKRITKPATRGMRGRPPHHDLSWKQRSSDGTLPAVDDAAADDEDEDHESGDGNFASAFDDSTYAASVGTRVGTDEDDDEVELDELVADIVEGVEAEAECAIDTKVRQSLYMTEKANKRKVLKDGRVVTGKIQRKDKGKPRFTAYAMWAREFRKSPKFGTKQDLDSASNARRLTELWANVPNNEKNIWRRKAKRLASKMNQQQESAAASTSSNDAFASNSAFLNRATTSRTKKLAADKEKPHQQKTIKSNSPGTSPYKRGRKELNEKIASPTNNVTRQNWTHHRQLSNNSHNTPHRHSNSTSSSQKHAHIKLPMSGIEPIDAAAHLKLLGESLSIIGERLKEHEGQITVSGSLSVLLDSLLCSVGPLMCLTTRIPGLEKRKDLNENLTATLDNIAYVMPGL